MAAFAVVALTEPDIILIVRCLNGVSKVWFVVRRGLVAEVARKLRKWKPGQSQSIGPAFLWGRPCSPAKCQCP